MTHHVSISWNIYIMYYLVTATHTAGNWQYKVGNHQMSYFENTQYRNYSMQVLVAIWPTKSSFWVANLCALYNDFIVSVMASQITGVSIVCSIVGSGADQRKHQSSASLAFVWGIHRWPVNYLHKSPVPRKMFIIDDVIMVPMCHLCPVL